MTPTEEAQGPRFSVVVPAFEAEATLAETLDALLAQTHRGWECVVVDDGSTDATLSIASTYADRDPRIRAVHQENQGTAGAYNTGVSAAIGDLIVICSADDILLPEHLARMSAFIDAEGGYEIYSSNGYYWRPGESREPFYRSIQGERFLSGELADVIHSLELADVIRWCFYSVGAVYRRDLFTAVGGYRPGVFAEDYDFWLRAMALGARHRYLPAPLSLHRVSPTQKSAGIDAAFRSDIRVISDLRRDFRLPPAASQAADESIRERERLIAQRGQLWRVARRAGARIAVHMVGRPRALRLYRTLMSTVGRVAPK